MQAIEINTVIGASAQDVFKALTEPLLLKAWFTPDLIAFPEAGTTAAFAIGEINFKMYIKDCKPPHRLTWQFVDGNVNWTGSEIQFSLEEANDRTSLSFHHINLPDIEKVDLWSASWGMYLEQLKGLCES